MTKQEIQAALKAATDKAAKLNALANRSPEQDEELDAAIAEAEGHVESLEAIRGREKADAERKSRIGTLAAQVGQPTPRVTKPAQPGAEPVFTSQRLAAEDDPNGGFKTPREFLMSVMDVGRGGRCDERLLPFRAAAGSDEQGEYSDSYGNFLLPVGLAPGLRSIQAEGDPTASLCTPMGMTSTTVKINARTDKTHTTSVSGGLRVYRRQETDDVTASRMQMEQVSYTGHSLMGVSYASEEILTDSPISFVSLLQAGFSDEFAAKMLDEKIRGTGVGEFEGVLNCPATVSIPKETGQAAATINLDNLIKMDARCWGTNKVWLANHDCKPQLAGLSFVSGTGGMPFWWGSARDGLPAMLLGHPIYFTEFCETVGTVGDIILADWSEYIVATLEGAKSDSSTHVRFLNHERAFKFWMRNDGRSPWRSALTPRKGANSLSPFVTLATRS